MSIKANSKMQFTNEELELIQMALLIVGKGRVFNTTFHPHALEPEYEIEARKLARVIQLQLNIKE